MKSHHIFKGKLYITYYTIEVESPLSRIFVVRFTIFINPNSTKKLHQKARI